MHEGSADSGHYYSYIKDHRANVWRRFNDHKVEIVAEEDVMSDANGGSVRSAYWLAYVSQEKISQLQNLDINAFDSFDVEANMVRHPYASLAKDNIKTKVREENHTFILQVAEFKANELAKKAMTRYENYYKEIKTILDSKQAKLEYANFYTSVLRD